MQRERLGHVVVRAELERENLVDFLIARGQHDDRHAAALTDLFTRFDAVQDGQHDIHDDQVGPFARRERDRRPSVAGRRDRIAVSLEIEAQRLKDRGLIVHDQNLLRLRDGGNHRCRHNTVPQRVRARRRVGQGAALRGTDRRNPCGRSGADGDSRARRCGARSGSSRPARRRRPGRPRHARGHPATAFGLDDVFGALSAQALARAARRDATDRTPPRRSSRRRRSSGGLARCARRRIAARIAGHRLCDRDAGRAPPPRRLPNSRSNSHNSIAARSTEALRDA